MIRIGVIGTIGVGKSTFLERLGQKINSLGGESIVFGEPSIIDEGLNRILEKFYLNTEKWAYPLQSGISAAHEGIYEEIKELEENNHSITHALVDAPYSSYIYCNIHKKAGRLSSEETQNIINISRPFHFDYIILLEETADETIERIMRRERGTELEDLSYMYEHIEDFKTFRKGYLETYFKDSEYIYLNSMPDIYSKEYDIIINKIAQTIQKGKKYELKR
jgi:deoxyadenosine/deoxycytidine kinase